MSVSPISARGGATLQDDVELALFGEDLLFTDDLQVTASGDYALVSGMAALRQSILNRLVTAPGEYAVRPDYGVGVRKWVKKRLTRFEQDNLRQTIIEQLGQEDRIEKVNEVTVERDDIGTNTGVKISVRVTAIGREQSFAFPTFTE
jgi:phage baseplate assembly protein W